MKYNQNFRKKKSLVFLRNLKLPYFFSTGKSKRKTAPLLPQNGMLLFVRVFKKYFPMLARGKRLLLKHAFPGIYNEEFVETQ